MYELVVRTAPIDSGQDIDDAIEQLTSIAAGDLVISKIKRNRRAGSVDLTVSVPSEIRFRGNLDGSPYRRFYKVID